MNERPNELRHFGVGRMFGVGESGSRGVGESGSRGVGVRVGVRWPGTGRGDNLAIPPDALQYCCGDGTTVDAGDLDEAYVR